MKSFAVYEKESGRIVASGTSFYPDTMADSRHSVLIVDHALEMGGYFISAGIVCRIPEKPPGHFRFNYQTKTC